MSEATQALARFYDAIDRQDMQAMIQDFDPGIVRIEPEGFPTAGTYPGIEQVQAHVAQGRGTWAEGHCLPEGYAENGDRVVALLRVRVRLHGASEWIDGRFADGFVFRGGRIVEYRTFGRRDEAMRWAGLGS